MVTKDNIVDILFQIGFHEADEYEIAFQGWEEKVAWKHGRIRFFIYDEYKVEIDYVKNNIGIMGVPKDKSSLFFASDRCLETQCNEIYELFKKEFQYEMRKIIIAKILNGK